MMHTFSKRIPVLLALAAALPVFAGDVSSSFYDKGDIRAFFSLGGDYRQMHRGLTNEINDLLFDRHDGRYWQDDSTGDWYYSTINDVRRYGRFGDGGTYPVQMAALHFDVGAQYRDFSTWFDINMTPTQVSRRPAASTSTGLPLWDAKWFTYGAEWMFGWSIPSAESPIQVIPSVGVGFNMLNVHFPAPGDIWYGNTSSDSAFIPYQIENTYYSAFGKTFNSQIETRILLPLNVAAGFYAGYRVVRYDRISIEYDGSGTNLVTGNPDAVGDQWFIGGKLTYILPSANMKRNKSKL